MIITQAIKKRDFLHDLSRKSLERGNFQESKTDMKQMKCYKRDLASKPLSNYYKFFKIFTFEIYNSQ